MLCAYLGYDVLCIDVVEYCVHTWNMMCCAPYLGYDGQFGAQVVKSDLADVDAVDKDGATGCLDDAEQREGEGRLARTSPTNYTDLMHRKQTGCILS